MSTTVSTWSGLCDFRNLFHDLRYRPINDLFNSALGNALCRRELDQLFNSLLFHLFHLLLSFVSSLLFSSLLFSSLLFSSLLFSSLLFSCLVLSCLVFSCLVSSLLLHLPLSSCLVSPPSSSLVLSRLSFSLSLSLSLSPCGVVWCVVCVVCCVLCVVCVVVVVVLLLVVVCVCVCVRACCGTLKKRKNPCVGPKTSPCVHSKRPRVCRHHAHLC